MRGAGILAIALAAAVALPATAGAAARQRSTYSVTKAAGTEKVSFSGDPSTCARFATCGYQGTVGYRFSGASRGKLVLVRDSRGRITGMGTFATRGTTTANITAGAPCADSVRHRSEIFSLGSTRGPLLFRLHGGRTDYLATDCAGPTETLLEAQRALPEGSLKRSHFEDARTSFITSGSSVFRAQGYRGTNTWRLRYAVTRHRCSPHCHAVSQAR